MDGLTSNHSDKNEIIKELREPGPNRLWFLGDAFRLGLSIEEIFQHSKIDPWFLYQIKDLIEIEEKMKKMTIKSFSSEILFDIKRKGFSDSRIANLIGKQAKDIRSLRYKHKIHPVYKRVDTCAAEFKAKTPYFYSTYEQVSEANPSKNKKIIIINGGPNRIGQGIEFDYCCVHASLALQEVWIRDDHDQLQSRNSIN